MLDLPPGVPEQFDEHIKLQFDLTALAFQADITRVATLLGARDLTGRELPVPEERAVPERRRQRRLPRRLAPPGRSGADSALRGAQPLSRVDAGVPRREAEGDPDGDGTLLDHSLILYGTNMGNSNQHQHYDVPHILVGGANGQLKGNRHLAYERKTVTTGNLLLSVLDMYGIHQEKQGDSTGRLRDSSDVETPMSIDASIAVRRLCRRCA